MQQEILDPVFAWTVAILLWSAVAFVWRREYIMRRRMARNRKQENK